MPGIAGIISKRPTAECQSLVKSMTNSMEYESFYNSGMHSVPELGICASWVAHEGSFGAGQPFFNERTDVVLLFSGECFADPETRTALQQKRHQVGQASGDWLVHLYEEEGDGFFEKLNGLFSGLLIDKRQSKAFLFNDRYGAERIYCHETEDALFFASEAKALLRVLPELRAFDREGVAQFLAFGCTLGQRTLFQGIELLPGASVWSFEKGNCEKKKYFSPETWESHSILPPDSFITEFEETFKRVLPRYFESESKIGISLTGGQDSRMVMACLPKAGEKPVCYTFSGENRDTLDVILAARIAEVCGLEHQILRIGPDFFSDFASHVDRTVYATDGYLGSLGAHEIYLNNQARALSPVRLTGVFGGEILRGVSMFKPLHLAHRLVNADLAETVTSYTRRWSHDGEHPITFAAFREVPEQRFAIVAASRSQVAFRSPYLDNEIVALAYQAPEAIRRSADCTSSLVKSNNPLLSKVPTDMGEMGEASRLATALRRIAAKVACKLDYHCSEGLPHGLSSFDPLLTRIGSALGIIGLHKYLPYRVWFQRDLAPYIDEILKAVQIRHSSLWNLRFLENMVSDHLSGRRNYVQEIDAVVTLDAVERLLFRDLPRGATLNHQRPASVTGVCNSRANQLKPWR
jgi:asparagine synthase (glutamine-hydrolysing)